MSKIEYHKGDLIGPHECIFLYETEADCQPCGRKNRRAQFLCPYCQKQEFNARISEVKRGKIRSCGCYRVISKQKTHTVDITNQRHGKLVALKRLSKKAKDNSYLWLCQCDCGKTTELTPSEFKRTNSCGCSKGFTEGEKIFCFFLDKENIFYKRQYSFLDCINPLTENKLYFDFYLPDYNCCIEIDGRQHREPVSIFGGIEGFKEIQYRDNIKNQYCKEKNILLIRIPYDSKRKEYTLSEERFKNILSKKGVI